MLSMLKRLTKRRKSVSKRINKAVERARERVNTPEDDFMAILHKQLQETGQEGFQLQQAMRPQTPGVGIRDIRQGDTC